MAACLAAGIALIALGAFAHFQSVEVTSLPAVAAPVPITPAPIATTGLQPTQPLASAAQPVTSAPQATTEPRHSAKRPIKMPRGVDARDARTDASKRSRRTPPRSMLEKLRLQWLKNAFTVQSAPL